MELGLPQNDRIILYASRLEQAKGLSYLLAAFKRVTRRRSDCLLVLVGDGSYRKLLEQETADLGLQDQVLFAGLRPHEEMVQWICACNLVVHPSLSEGSPLPVYEGLACGRPVIASRVGGIPELITSDNYGLLVPPANAEVLAESLLLGLEMAWDSQLIRNYGVRHSWSAVADRLLDLYEEVLQGEQ
jgi:glycosyltransferase involved in cell wall biosynthesis